MTPEEIVKRLRGIGGVGWTGLLEAADLIESLVDENRRLRETLKEMENDIDMLKDAVADAYNSGFCEGMREHIGKVARDIVLEEAAKVADGHAQSAGQKFDGVVDRAQGGAKNMELAGATAIGMDHSARYIAAAIRALKGESDDRL
jgi:cell division septum initiation protein DivIVA